MAVYIARALAGGDDSVPEFTGAPTFPDVGEGFWALDYVEYAVAQNVVAGYEDGTYHPEYQVTRDQMAVYVARSICDPTGEDGLAGYTPADPRNFPDVDSDFWAYKHIEYCVENGVVQGYEDGYYHPEMVVTRDQMAVYVAKAFGLL
jgi:N-acetylmuramoyl-L-alanine amidase